MTNAATGVKITYQFPWGEGAPSAAGSATPTAHAGLLISGTPLVPPVNALWTNIYIETAAGSGVYKLYGTTYGSSVIAFTYGTGQAIPTGLASGALEYTQFLFASTFAGISAQRKIGSPSTARIFGNSADNVIMVYQGGCYEADCASATFNIGDFVGMAKDTGNTLTNQNVVAVSSPALAIGRVIFPGTSVTKVQIEVKSTLDPTNASQYQYTGVGAGVL